MAALNYAKQASNMKPNEFRYRQLVAQLEGSSSFYRQSGQRNGYGNMGTFLCGNPCLTCCILNALLNCLCGGCGCGGSGGYGGGGYYGRF